MSILVKQFLKAQKSLINDHEMLKKQVLIFACVFEYMKRHSALVKENSNSFKDLKKFIDKVELEITKKVNRGEIQYENIDLWKSQLEPELFEKLA